MIEDYLKLASQLYSETRGAYFTLQPSNCGKFWKLRIDSIGEFFKGTINQVLLDYIEYVKKYREKSKVNAGKQPDKPYKLL